MAGAGRAGLKPDDLAVAGGVVVVAALAGWAWLPLGLGVAAGAIVLAVLGAGRHVRRALDHHDRQVEARLWLAATLDPRAPLPPMGGWAMSADLARAVVEHVLAARPARILECGSGASTLLVGYALERVGRGRLVALEHDEGYAAQTAGRIRLHGLEGRVEVVHAPLEPVEVEGETHLWYRLPPPEGPFDLLVIDGPPAPPASRYPAIPLLAPRLAPDAVAFLDDARRGEGRRNLERWGRRTGVEVETLATEKGAAVLRGIGRGR